MQSAYSVHSTYGRCWVAMHIAACKWPSSQPSSSKPPQKRPFSRLILGAGGEAAPWACACTPRLPDSVPPPPPPTPLPWSSSSQTQALSEPCLLLGRRTAWTRGADHFHSPQSTVHTLILTPAVFSLDLSAPLRLCTLGGTLDSFATCKYRGHSRFPSPAGASVKHLGASLPRRRPSSTSRHAPNRNSTPDRHRLACPSYTAPHPPILVSAQPPSGLHDQPYTNQLLISLRPTKILSPSIPASKSTPNAPRKGRENESAPGPAQYFLDGARPGPQPVWKAVSTLPAPFRRLRELDRGD